jgi:hypothetical protein
MPEAERWGWRLVGPDRQDKTVYTTLESGAGVSLGAAQQWAERRLAKNHFATAAYVWSIGPSGGWDQRVMLSGVLQPGGKVVWA